MAKYTQTKERFLALKQGPNGMIVYHGTSGLDPALIYNGTEGLDFRFAREGF